MAFDQDTFTCRPNIKNRFWVQHSLDEWEAHVNDKMADSFAKEFPEYGHVREDYDDATNPVEDEVDAVGMRPADVVANPEPLDTLEVSWTPIKRGYEAALTDANPLEIDHDEQSLRAVFAKYGQIGKLIARRAAFGEAVVVFSTEQQARVAASCANNVAKLTVQLRLPTVDDSESTAATMEGVERVESRHNKVLHRMSARQYVEATATRITVWDRLHAAAVAKTKQEELLRRQEEERKYGLAPAPIASAEEYRARAIEDDEAAAAASGPLGGDGHGDASEAAGSDVASVDLDKDDPQAEIARETAKLPVPTELDISAQHLKCGDVRAIALALRKNGCITSLDLRANEVLDDGMKALIELLEWNKTIVQVHLDWYSTVREGMEVEALYPHMDTFGRVRWGNQFVPATVTRVGAGGAAFDLRFYDGLKFPNMDREQIQSPFRPQDPVAAGEVILARYEGGAKWFPAKVYQIRQTGEIDVVFLGGEKGAGYKREWLRNAYQPSNNLVARVEELVAHNVEQRRAADERARLAEIERLLELKRTRWRRRRAKAIAAARAVGDALLRLYGHAVHGLQLCQRAAAQAHARVLPEATRVAPGEVGADAPPLPLRAGRHVKDDRTYVAAFMDGALGMGVEDVALAMGGQEHVRVGRLVPNGQASRAGICVGDHVRGVDGVMLARPTEDMIAACVSKAARPMTITFYVPMEEGLGAQAAGAGLAQAAEAPPPVPYQSAWARLRHERVVLLWSKARSFVSGRKDDDDNEDERDVAAEVRGGVTRWVIGGGKKVVPQHAQVEAVGDASGSAPAMEAAAAEEQETSVGERKGPWPRQKKGRARQLAPLEPEKQTAAGDSGDHDKPRASTTTAASDKLEIFDI